MSDLNNNIPDLEEYEPEIVDLDGEPFEVIDAIEFENETYVALIPHKEDAFEMEEIEFVILKEVEENGEVFLATIEDETIYDKIGNAFLEHFDAIDDEE